MRLSAIAVDLYRCRVRIHIEPVISYLNRYTKKQYIRHFHPSRIRASAQFDNESIYIRNSNVLNEDVQLRE